MKAVTRRAYGGPERLAFEAVPAPEPEEGQVVVRVHAASLNMADWHYLTGEPWLVRPTLGWRTPRSPTFGMDVAGTVAAIGSAVEGYAVGDRVFGVSGRGFAELAPLNPTRVAAIPSGVGFADAAALPVAGVTALQAVAELGEVSAGDRVLVNGASGGVGHLAVQIARLLGAEVTGVCSARNAEMVRDLGAVHVIDHTTTDYAATGERYDVIIDVQGTRGGRDNLRALTERGRWILVGGPKDNRALGPLPWALGGLALAAFSSRTARMFIAAETSERLALLASWVAAGELRPVIERTVSLAELPEAMHHLGSGRTRGKQVVQVA